MHWPEDAYCEIRISIDFCISIFGTLKAQIKVWTLSKLPETMSKMTETVKTSEKNQTKNYVSRPENCQHKCQKRCQNYQLTMSQLSITISK